MKKIKRISALFMVVAMLMTMLGGISVNAEETASGDAIPSVSYDFSEFTTNDEASMNNDDWTVQIRRRTNVSDKTGSDLMNYESVKGALGKATDDGAIKIAYSPEGIIEANADPASFFRLQPKNPIFVENGDFYEISLDMAWAGAGSSKEIRVGIPGDDGSLTGVIAYLLNISSAGVVKSPALIPDNGGKLTKSANYTVAANTWYNYRFVVKAGENKPESGLTEDMSYHWIYINGTLVSEGPFVHYERNKGMQDKITRFRGFSYMWFLCSDNKATTKPTADSEYKNDNPATTYIDNVRISKPSALPEIVNTKTMDFNTFTPSNDTASVKSQITAIHGFYPKTAYQNLTGDVYNIRDGVYGKAAGDRSLFMQKSAEWTHSIDETQYVQYEEAGYHTGGLRASIYTEPDDFYEMQLSMAWDGETENKAVQTFYNIDQEGDGKAVGYTINVAPNGSVVAMGTSIPEAGNLLPNTWYKFNLVIHAGDNTAESDDDKNWFKFYINDELVKDKTVFSPIGRTVVKTENADGSFTSTQKNITYNKFMGFKKYWLTLQTLKTNNPEGTATPGAYFDDFVVRHCGTTEPVYTGVKISSDDAVVDNYLNSGCSYQSYYDDRAAGKTINVNDGTVELFDAKYNPVSALDGKLNHYKITRNDGTVLFGTLRNANTVAKNEVFEKLDAGTKANFNYAQKAYTVENYETGVAGKNANDYALTMKTTETYQDNKDNLNPFLQVTIGSKETIGHTVIEDIYTVAFSIRATGEFNSTNLLFIPLNTENGEGWYNAMNFTSNGQVFIRGNLDNSRSHVADIRPGEWVRFAMTVYPDTNMVEIYFNDKLIETQQMWFNGANKLARFKIEQAFLSAGEDDKKTGEFSIDDFRIYCGSRPAMDPVELESMDEDLFKVYNDGDIIFMPEEVIYEDIASNVAGFGTAKVMPAVFTDASMTEALTSMDDVLEDGNVFVVSNDEGTVYEYFYLAEGEPSVIKVLETTNSNGTPAVWTNGGHRDLRAHFACYKSFEKNATVVVAQYDKSGNLLSTGLVTNEYAVSTPGTSDYCWPKKADSGTITMDLEDVPDYTVKLFVLDGMGSLKPLIGATTVK